MEITINITTLIVGLITLVGTVIITFYVKDYLQRKLEYKQLRRKLEKIAGKNATILYCPSAVGLGAGLQEFKIIDIDGSGITIKNELLTVFIPPNKLLQTEMILPDDDYETLKAKKVKKDMEQLYDAMMPAIFNKMLPEMINAIEENMIQERGELSMVIGMKIAKVLESEGITKIKK
jgi:hypothetical protein